jgi:hypothetical protein
MNKPTVSTEGFKVLPSPNIAYLPFSEGLCP